MSTRLLGLLLCLGMVGHARAAERLIGKIAATAPTAKNNSTTAVPFGISSGAKISIQCDAPVYVAVSQSVAALATADEVKVAADQLFPTSTPSGTGVPSYVSVLPVSGSATCRVYTRTGNEV